MGQLQTMLMGMAGTGVLAVVIAVVVPMSVLGTRDRGEGEPTAFASPTPVLMGVTQGQLAPSLPPTAVPTNTPAPPTPVPTTPAQPPTSIPTSTGSAGAGQQVFETASPLTCQTCHSLDGATGLGPSLQGISTNGATRVAGLSAEAYIRQSIMVPGAYVVEGFIDGLMPVNFLETLTPDDIDNVVAFLLGQ